MGGFCLLAELHREGSVRSLQSRLVFKNTAMRNNYNFNYKEKQFSKKERPEELIHEQMLLTIKNMKV